MEIRGLFEREVCETLTDVGGVPGLTVPCLPGAADAEEGDRPEQYVVVAVTEAEERGTRYLLQVEIYVVAPVDEPGVVLAAKQTAQDIEAWLRDPLCPLQGGRNAAGTLQVEGFSLRGSAREVRGRSVAEVLSLSVGAARL